MNWCYGVFIQGLSDCSSQSLSAFSIKAFLAFLLNFLAIFIKDVSLGWITFISAYGFLEASLKGINTVNEFKLRQNEYLITC